MRYLRIPLTRGKFAIVGPKDYAFLMQWKWCYLKHHSGGGYAVRTDYTNGKQTIRMHRVILERMGFKNFVKSDHINRNKLDNRRCNLRPATNSQSQCNQGKRKDNTSGYIGIGWHKQARKWHTRIMVNRKEMSLGLYDDLKEAARVYNEAALKYHGEFAVLNVIENESKKIKKKATRT